MKKGGYLARLGSRLLGVVDVSIKCFYCHLLHSILNTYIIPYLPLNYMNNLRTRFLRPILLKQTTIQNDRHDKVNDVQNDNRNQ